MGYMYGLRMDLIGQSDGVGLHRAVGSKGQISLVTSILVLDW